MTPEQIELRAEAIYMAVFSYWLAESDSFDDAFGGAENAERIFRERCAQEPKS